MQAGNRLPVCNGSFTASMQQRSLPKRVPMSTVTLHRVIHASPERIYRAFLQADAVAKWLPLNGFTCTVEHLHAYVGGSFFRMAFATGQRRTACVRWHLRRADLMRCCATTMHSTPRRCPAPWHDSAVAYAAVRHRSARGAERHSSADSAACLLAGLAGFVDAVGASGGSASGEPGALCRAPTALRCSNGWGRVFRVTAALHVALTPCTPLCATSCAALEPLGSLKGAGIRSWTTFADR